MKKLIFIMCCLMSSAIYGKNIEVEVFSTHIGIEDYQKNKTLCLTVIKNHLNPSLLGIVEDIYDCYYARKAKNSPSRSIIVDIGKLRPIEETELLTHLRNMDRNLEYLFSDGE